jgi:hypothetical protein
MHPPSWESLNGTDFNHVLVVADSTRFDTFVQADTPFLKRMGHVRLAYAQATYTWPAHMAMMVGHLPHCFQDVPFYNRYRRQLWRLGTTKGTGGGKHQQLPFISLPSEHSLPDGFRKLGFTTIGTGAVSWFSHPIWKSWFELFRYEPDAERQVDWFLEQLPTHQKFFGFLNFGETHEPYSYPGQSQPMPMGYQEHKLLRGPVSAEDFASLHRRQVWSLEFLDRCIERLCSQLPKATVVVFTADHGECFGEDDLFGHGFYHPKVMEVPLLVTCLGDR